MPKPLAVVPYDFIKGRYDFDKLLRCLIRLDYSGMRGLTKTTEGTHDNWVRIFKKSPYSSRYLVNSRLDILGYWHFVSLKEPYFKKAKKGMLLDSQIKPSSIYPLNKKGFYTIYIVETLLVPKYKDTNAIVMLDYSFFDAIYDFAKEGVYFTEVLVDAFTADGRKWCVNLGMKLVAKNTLHRDMYYMDFEDFVLKNAPKRTNLIKAYFRHFKHDNLKTAKLGH